jgi:uncharacterized CHY-type Zn-finger protein
MALYKCFNCDRLIDDDIEPCTIHPTNKSELICEECAAEIQEKDLIDLHIYDNGESI